MTFFPFQFLLISTKDEHGDDELSLIDRDVAGPPLSDDDDVVLPTLDNGVDVSTLDNDVFRASAKDPIEGDLFEGDISGVRIVATSDVDERNVTIKNAIINTYQVNRVTGRLEKSPNFQKVAQTVTQPKNVKIFRPKLNLKVKNLYIK